MRSALRALTHVSHHSHRADITCPESTGHHMRSLSRTMQARKTLLLSWHRGAATIQLVNKNARCIRKETLGIPAWTGLFGSTGQYPSQRSQRTAIWLALAQFDI